MNKIGENPFGHLWRRQDFKNVQKGWYCADCGYFTERLDAKERALTCRKATTPAELQCHACDGKGEIFLGNSRLDGQTVERCEDCDGTGHASKPELNRS